MDDELTTTDAKHQQMHREFFWQTSIGTFNACRRTLQCPDGTTEPHKRFLGLLLPPTRVKKLNKTKEKRCISSPKTMRLSVKILQIKIAIDIGVAPYIRVHTWRIRRLPNLSIYLNLETWKISTARARRSQRIDDIPCK